MKDFKKYFIIPAPPEDVFRALTVETAIALWTGDPAVMKPEPGSEFSMWDGSIVGKNLEFQEGKLISQQWYFGDQEPASTVTIKLHAHDQGTSMEVRQTNIPDADYDDIADGWTYTYAAGLIDFFDEQSG